MRSLYKKSLWTVWRPVVRGSKSDDPAYRRPNYVGSLKSIMREKRKNEVGLSRIGLVAAKAGDLLGLKKGRRS